MPTPLETQVWTALGTVMDPELNVDIVSLGLIYSVQSSTVQSPSGSVNKIHIIMTLTTPGCPLASVFDGLLRSALFGIPNLDSEQDVTIELTFDPPWVPDMMSAEARAELGFD